MWGFVRKGFTQRSGWLHENAVLRGGKKKGKERAKQDSPSCLKAVVGSWWGFNFASAVAGS